MAKKVEVIAATSDGLVIRFEDGREALLTTEEVLDLARTTSAAQGETQEQGEIALVHRCDVEQSWSHGTPQPAQALVDLVRTQRKSSPLSAVSVAAFSSLRRLDWSGIRQVFDSVANGITISDAREVDLPLIYTNPAFERMTGYGMAETFGQNCRFLQGADRNQSALEALRQSLLEQRDTRVTLKNFKKDGTAFWNELYLSPIRNHDGEITHYLGVQNDITARIELEERLAHAASHDMLTGLPNRSMLMERIAEAMGRAQGGGVHFALLFLDLDNFKHVNDMFGHEEGDELLKAIGHRLAASARSHETVARLSGDEFIVLLEDFGNDEELTQVIRRLTDELQQPVLVAGQAFHPHASIGMAMYPRDGGSPKELLRAADMAMYTQKHLRNNVGEAVLKSVPEIHAEPA